MNVQKHIFTNHLSMVHLEGHSSESFTCTLMYCVFATLKRNPNLTQRQLCHLLSPYGFDSEQVENAVRVLTGENLLGRGSVTAWKSPKTSAVHLNVRRHVHPQFQKWLNATLSAHPILRQFDPPVPQSAAAQRPCEYKLRPYQQDAIDMMAAHAGTGRMTLFVPAR